MNKYTKYANIKWAEFESVGGGEGDAERSEARETDSPEIKSQSAAFDPKEFAKEFSSAFTNEFVSKTQKEPEQKQISPEEAKKLLNVWEPDDNYFQRFGNMDTQKAAFLEMRDGLIKQMDTIMQARQYQMDQQWKQQFEPVQQMLTQRQHQEQIDKFEKAYPSLAKPSLSDVRTTIGQRLQASGAFKDKTEPEAFKILAEAMASVAKEFDPNFSLETSASNNSKTSRNGNSITPSSLGSQGGGSGGGGNSDSGFKQPKAVSFLPKIKG